MILSSTIRVLPCHQTQSVEWWHCNITQGLLSHPTPCSYLPLCLFPSGLFMVKLQKAFYISVVTYFLNHREIKVTVHLGMEVNVLTLVSWFSLHWMYCRSWSLFPYNCNHAINWPNICCVGCVVYISVTPKSKSYNTHLVWPTWRHGHGNLRHKTWRDRREWPSCTTTKELARISTKHCTQSTLCFIYKSLLEFVCCTELYVKHQIHLRHLR